VKIGFLVNPVSGMGGRVGLKGTDGSETQRRAEALGAERSSPGRAVQALGSIDNGLPLEFLTCAGEMGRDELDAVTLPSEIVYSPRQRTTREDTQAAVKTFLEENVDLVLFAGGDGTARDVLEVVGGRVPILGIPAGVKMQSAVFALTPEEVGGLLASFVSSGVLRDGEVLDVDEEGFRRGEVRARLYGVARVPDAPGVQSGKQAYHLGSSDDEAAEIAQYIVDSMEDDVLYIIGPGSTTARIGEAMGQEKTLLGVDAYIGRKPLRLDASEKDLLSILETHDAPTEIIVTPIGAQGFFFGRGNQQISPDVIRRVGPENVVIVATPSKLNGTPMLRSDTGDADLDRSLSGKRRVVTGYKRRRLIEVG
jgi:predicted polyphosphate/ATP-dependent NAD kinase